MVSRRALLGYGLGAAGSLLLPGCATRAVRGPAGKPRSESIAIVGAGAAGLAAAQELRRRGFMNLSIFEARNRIGGRVHTLAADDGTPYELGAGWVHGHTDNSIYSLMKERNFPLRLSGSNSDTQLWNARGLPVTRNESRKRHAKFVRYLERIRENAKAEESLAEAIHRLGPPPDPWTEHFLRSNVVETEGAELNELAAREPNAPGGADGFDFIPGPGYAAFFEGEARQLSVHLNVRVEAIGLERDDVRLSISENGQPRTENFSAVILTLPLGVLKARPEIFEFNLPDWKQAAINNIGYGHFAKIILRFPEAFWPPDARWMERMGAADRITQFFPLSPFTGSKTLIGIAGGHQAMEWQNATDERLRKHATKQLRQQFGKRVPDPVQMIRTDWSYDPFARGAYSFFAKTTSVTDYEKLAAPLNDRLYFAGEATNAADYGTVHGAWDSGRRAAAELAQKFT